MILDLLYFVLDALLDSIEPSLIVYVVNFIVYFNLNSFQKVLDLHWLLIHSEKHSYLLKPFIKLRQYLSDLDEQSYAICYLVEISEANCLALYLQQNLNTD